MGDNAKPIIIVGVILLVGIGAFLAIFQPWKSKEETAGVPASGATTASTTTPGGPPGMLPDGTAIAAAPEEKKEWTPLKAPPPPGLPKPVSTGDPFANGPKPPPLPPPDPPPPPIVRVAAIPPMSPASSRRRGPVGIPSSIIVAQAPPVGRHAGWIYNSNGQIIAIFEDAAGNARSLHVGDSVEDKRVKAISPEYLVLVDDAGREQQLKLQGLETYPGKTRTTDVTATPAMAPWGGAP